MKQTKLRVLSALAAAALMLTACSGSAGSGSSSTAASAGSTSAAAASDKKIVYWSMWESTEPQAIAIQQIADEYEQETGIEVDVQFKGRAGINDGLIPALDAGTTIDMFDQTLTRIAVTFADYCLDLNDLVEQTGYEETANAALMSYSRECSDGALLAIPYQINAQCYFYNAKIFEEAGVEAVPTTWEEFLDVCQKIKDAGYIPVTTDDAYAVRAFNHHLGRYIGQDAELLVSNEGLWDDPAVLQTAKDFAEMASLGYFSPNVGSNVWPNGQNVEFGGGQAAMYFCGSFLPNELSSIVGDDFEWGAFAYPALDPVESNVEGAEANDTTYNILGAQAFGINVNSEVPEETFNFIAKLTQGEGDALLANESNAIPSDTTNTEWPELLAPVKEVVENTQHLVNYSADGNSNIAPMLKENALKLYGGTMTPEEFVQAMLDAGV